MHSFSTHVKPWTLYFHLLFEPSSFLSFGKNRGNSESLPTWKLWQSAPSWVSPISTKPTSVMNLPPFNLPRTLRINFCLWWVQCKLTATGRAWDAHHQVQTQFFHLQFLVLSFSPHIRNLGDPFFVPISFVYISLFPSLFPPFFPPSFPRLSFSLCLLNPSLQCINVLNCL